MMNKHFFKAWALLASAIAFVLLGILIGRGTGSESQPATVESDFASSNPRHDNQLSEATATPQDMYQVPGRFTQIPSEWRTVVDNSQDGYAILFDPPEREVIVEQCLHRGYFDAKGGAPRDQEQSFCQVVLWGTLISLGEQSAVANDRSGERVAIALELSAAAEQTTLMMGFGDHRMTLVPGSKNDLFQDMEKLPAIREEKRLHYEYGKAQYEQLVKDREKATEHN